MCSECQFKIGHDPARAITKLDESRRPVKRVPPSDCVVCNSPTYALWVTGQDQSGLHKVPACPECNRLLLENPEVRTMLLSETVEEN